MRLLVTRPGHDPANHYLYHWTISLLDLAKAKGIEVFDLARNKSSRVRVQGYLKKNQATHVFLNGHGGEAVVCGYDNEEILSTSDDLSLLLGGKVLFVRACDAGKMLGTSAVKKGAEAFIGYKSEFRFWYRKEYVQKPLEDPFARPFMECSNQVGVSLLKGHSPKVAHDNSLRSYRREIVKALTSEGDTALVPALIHNMKSQICID